MRKNLTLSLLAVAIALSGTFILQSCSTVHLNNDSIDNNNAIARVYIGLSSNIKQRKYEIEDVENILANHFDGVTLQESVGFYNGEEERILTVTIINCCRWEESKEIFRDKINNLVTQLRQDLGQESILVEYITQERLEAFEVFE